MQECLIRLWRLESEHPGRTRSWYLQNCRYHLQHLLVAGRSVDSLKRAIGDNRIPIDGVSDELPADWYHTNGELLEMVSARDIVLTLADHLRPREQKVLGGLADGLVLRDVALKAKLSYPTALKYRRKIAALTIKLGIADPAHKKENTPEDPQVNGTTYTGEQTNGNKGHRPFPKILKTNRGTESKINGQT
jgi:DNA-binding CsgD family transcriptional regulator